MKKFKEISEAKATPEEKAQLSLKHAKRNGYTQRQTRKQKKKL